ncbi:hypothetical protein GEV33_001050 [Tenebrio molitor]|uniref:Uncharacterized protein n=1 Tax=Tenebrio molitor TaxID=7067 RepID=A0A8J6HXW5_TENMO|nr:hypothetical protein GEV33_001050 [Tenebrio molitor]
MVLSCDPTKPERESCDEIPRVRPVRPPLKQGPEPSSCDVVCPQGPPGYNGTDVSSPATLVLLACLENQDHRDHKVEEDLQVREAKEVNLDDLDIQVRRVYKVFRVFGGYKAYRDHLEPPETMAHQAPTGPRENPAVQALRVKEEPMEALDFQDFRVYQAHRDLQVRSVITTGKVLSDPKADAGEEVLEANAAFQEILEEMAVPVCQVPRATEAKLVHLVKEVLQDLQDLLDPPEYKSGNRLLVIMFRDYQDLEESPDFQECKELKATKT